LAGARLLRQAQTRQAHNIDEGATMAKELIHTVYKSGQWINEIEEGEEIGGVHATKEEAVRAGRARAQQDRTEHVIHNQDGTISERNSYGNDSASRPG
jgi:uncharacterized damage-inducible protein DinB